MNLTRASILELAPDASSSKAAQGLVNPKQWATLGSNEVALWGECQGSGAKPYQTQIDLSQPSFKCSCPSRKFPCKHGLALMLLHVERNDAFTASTAPPWVTEWLNARTERERKRETQRQPKKKSDPTPADIAVAAERDAKREQQRWERIELGAQELDRWLNDLLARGFATLTPDKLDDWQTMAARLVDAQAPGFGQRLRQAQSLIGRSVDWPERLMQQLGLLVLAIRAVERRAQLPASSLADLRVAIGWPIEKADVTALADTVEDDWIVLGTAIEERDAKLVERRVWLQQANGARRALILEHAFGGRAFEHVWPVGATMHVTLAFYPSSAPLRAVTVGTPQLRSLAIENLAEAASEWATASERFGVSPWTPFQPMFFSEAVISVSNNDELSGLVQQQALTLSVAVGDYWPLLAVTGGNPVSMMGEWDGDRLKPLTLWRGTHLIWQRSSQI